MFPTRFARSECHQAARFIQHYLDGELDIVRTVTVAEHLETCRRCGLEATTYEAIKIAIGASGTHSLPADRAAADRLRAFADDLSREG